jgi:hypothetical protein
VVHLLGILVMAIIYCTDHIKITDDRDLLPPASLPLHASPEDLRQALEVFGPVGGGGWSAFKQLVIQSEPLAAIMLQANVINPQLAFWLPVALGRAEDGRMDDFALAWPLVVAAASVPPAALESFAETARSCGLPASFVAILGPS